jgi:hypothetical protein
MTLEFSEKEFEILAQLPDAKQPAWFSVTGTVTRHFGIFKAAEGAQEFWSITHLPSGRRVYAVISEDAAKQIIKVLLEEKIAWGKPKFSPVEQITLVNLLIKHAADFQANGWLVDTAAKTRAA